MGKVFIGVLFMAILAGCDPGTPLGDVVYPEKTCAQDLTVENQGSRDLVMYVGLQEMDHDAACKSPYSTNQEKTVAPGAKDAIHLKLTCRRCESVQKGFSIYHPGDKQAVLYNSQSGSNNVFCSDTVCLGR